MASYFAHESSYIDDGAVVGVGTKIWHFCHVLPGAVIGERCNLGQNVVVMGGAPIEDGDRSRAVVMRVAVPRGSLLQAGR